MANAEVSRQIMENAEFNAELDESTAAWGGEAGKKVSAMSTESQEAVRDSLMLYSTHLREKYNQDPESLTDAELGMVKLAQSKEAYKPADQAKAYGALSIMERQLGDPNSEFAKAKRLYETGPKGETRLTEAGRKLQAELAAQRGEIFRNLTGIDPVAEKGYKRPGVIKVAWASGRRAEAVKLVFSAEAYRAAEEQADKTAQEESFQDRSIEFTVETRIQTKEKAALDSAKERARVKVEQMLQSALRAEAKVGARTQEGLAAANRRKKYELLLEMVGEAETMGRLTEVIANSGNQAEIAPLLGETRAADELVFEGMVARELDEHVARAAVQEVAGSADSIEVQINQLDQQIRVEGNPDRVKELRRQRNFMKGKLEMIQGNAVDQMLGRKKEQIASVGGILELMPGLDRDIMMEELADELELGNIAADELEERINAQLKKSSKPSIMLMVAHMLNGGSARGATSPSARRQTNGNVRPQARRVATA